MAERNPDPNAEDHHIGNDSDTTRAEIKLAGFFAEHNISFNTADHLVELSKNILPDSDILTKVYLKRTKLTKVIEEVGQCSKDHLHQLQIK